MKREVISPIHSDSVVTTAATKATQQRHRSAVPVSDRLPQTGQKANKASEIIGLATVAVAGLLGLAGIDRKKKRN